jgi:hypothetical protein
VKILPETAEGTGQEKPKCLEAYEYYMKGMHFIKSNYVISFKEDDFKAGVEKLVSKSCWEKRKSSMRIILKNTALSDFLFLDLVGPSFVPGSY